MLDHDIYDDTNPDLEPLWLLEPTAETVAINDFDATRVPTLQGLRSTADRVLDGASRSHGMTRADAHQDLWVEALSLAGDAYTQVREEGACQAMADLRDRVLAHAARTTEQDQRDAVTSLKETSQPQEGHLRHLAWGHHVRLLTGVAVWLPLIGHTMDALHAEGPTIGALLRDHLAQLGVTDLTYGPIDGHGPEGLEIGAPKGRILVSASNELLSVPLGSVTALLAAHDSADADPGALLHSTDQAPVTATDLQVMAHKVATALDALAQGEALTGEKDTPTVREVHGGPSPAQARARRIRAVEHMAPAADITGLTELLRRVLERSNDPDTADEAAARHLLLHLEQAPTADTERTFSYLVNEERTPQLRNQRQAWLNGHPWSAEENDLVAAAEFATDLMCALTARDADAAHILGQLSELTEFTADADAHPWG